MMDSKDVNGVISATPIKRRQFLYPESDWPQTNNSPRVENMPSLAVEPVDSIRPSSQSPASTSSVARSSASTPHDIMSPAVANPTLKRIHLSLSCNKNGPAGRKRKMSDRETEEDKKTRTKEKKLRRNHVHERTSAPASTKKASRDAMETDDMRYGKMFGYNVVPDYDNYLVVRSAYGYGDISRSSIAITRSPESLPLRHQHTSFEKTDKIITPRDKVDQLVRNGGCPRHNTRSDPNNYLVVQSVFGYGNISQSSSMKREDVQYMLSYS